MRRVTISAALAAMLSAAPVFAMGFSEGVGPSAAEAQAAGQQPPAGQQPAPKPAQPAPTTPAPSPQPAAQPPQPFPEGAKFAYVILQVVAQNSVEGKAASGKIEELQKKKQAELQEKNKQLQALQQKLASSGTVLNDSARGQLEKEIDRTQREIQFAQQNAQAEVQELTRDLQEGFQAKLMPIVDAIGKERSLHAIFTSDSGMIWAAPGLDITQEVIKRLDAGKPAAK